MLLDQRLESVSHTLSLAYQFMLALDDLEKTGTIDPDAVSALAALLLHARNDARIVWAALPAPLRLLDLEDDYEGPRRGGEPLQPILDEYRKRGGKDALLDVMDGGNRSLTAKAATTPRRRKAKAA